MRYVADVEVVGLAIALVALVIALVALQRSRHGKRRDERGPAQRLTPDRKPAPAEGVHFELRPAGESLYRLKNVGTETAYDVKLRAHRLGKNASYDEFDAGDVDDIELTPKAEAERNVVEITWHERRDHTDRIHHKLLRVPQ
ncbi:hypothetical protein [Phytoactinopolyspora halotolerans]|uniref:Uncharacterized protein n=1 Tax=Phytoactinopolyspora halotolerans TaxID=1981512 RepID=A0A6L9S5W1_9ACTN|nr:hypothetical protein [Phytoactinopolyspora halotolerans]NEE00373.1 hypothetical protein [Phytoactinopolyspora halotolerans]